jgi:hypothetical protein
MARLGSRSRLGSKNVTDILHELFLPYPVDELRLHFVDSDTEGEDPERHLKRWRARLAAAPSKDPSFLDRDETLWTAGALMSIQHQVSCTDCWQRIMSKLFGPGRSRWRARARSEEVLLLLA